MNESPPPTVLVVEDDDALRDLLAQALPAVGFEVLTARTATGAMDHLASESVDLVLTDVHLGPDSGIELCGTIRARHPLIPVLVMTAFGSLDLAIDSMRAGAWDFLIKPLDLQLARLALDRALDHRRLRLEVRRLRARARRTRAYDALIGESQPMVELFRLIDRVAGTTSSVLIRGESGTGKELVARALHKASSRADKPFVAINCAAVPEALLESELFGHVQGAFTDAKTNRTGLFAQAHGGTLFLDEIGDMPQGLQAKLLRVLQERTIRPVGGDREQKVDVRMLAATHQDLELAVEQGRFRGDLLYRLDVIRLDVPALRDRGADVLLLAQRFLAHFSSQLGREVTALAPEVAARLVDYDWPGNVRELQNCIERGVVLAEFDTLSLEDLPQRVRNAVPRETVLASASDPAAMLPLAEVEKRYILQVLDAVGGHRNKAADILKIDRKTLYRKLDRWKAEG